MSSAISTEFRTLDKADRLPDNYVSPDYLEGSKKENLSRPHWREAVRIR